MSVATIRRLFALAALALAAIPAHAGAAPPSSSFDPLRGLPPRLREEVPARMNPSSSPAPFLSAMVLKPGHGYRVAVLGVGSAVLLEVMRGHRNAITAYVARGTVTPGRLQASFGDLGSVAMRFRQSSNRTWEKPHRRCKGSGRFVNRRGVYVGDIRFRGEGGYISIHAHRVKGRVSSVAPRCRRSPSSQRSRRAIRPSQQGSPFELDSLDASWRHGVTSTSVGAITLGARALFFASTEQSEGKLAVLRFAFARASVRAFTVDNALTRAQISPPAPFKGTGIYRAAADGTRTWSGGLTADFPGAPRLPLTGPEFKSVLETGL